MLQRPGAGRSFLRLIACEILMTRKLLLLIDCGSLVCPDNPSVKWVFFFSPSFFQVLDGLLAQYGTVENCEQGRSEKRCQLAVI